MIDDEKIVEASEKYAKEMEETCKKLAKKYKSATSLCNWVTVSPEAAFQAGINWFLKGLWHSISDKPEEHTDIIYIDEDKDFWDINNYDSNNFDDSFGKGWESACRTQDIYKWAYKDDLFPKEGGEK